VATIGRGFKADLLVLGAVDHEKGEWRVTLRLLDTQTGKEIGKADSAAMPSEATH